MKLRSRGPVALMTCALIGGSLAAPARAQQAGATQGDSTPADRSVSVNLQNVPVRTALSTLFSQAGVRSFVVDPDVQGYANVQVSDVPFSLALRQLLRSVTPALDFTAANGSYYVTLKQAAPATADAPPAESTARSAQGGARSTRVAANDGGFSGGAGSANAAGQPLRFYPIPINKYDAYYIAALLGATGVVKVDVNGVIPSAFGTTTGGQGGGQGGGFGTGQGGFGGQGGGFGGQGGGYGGGGGGRGGGRGGRGGFGGG